jgi:hypothetical protein
VFPPELFLGQALGDLARHGKGICLRMVAGSAPDLLTLLRKRELDLLVADPACWNALPSPWSRPPRIHW